MQPKLAWARVRLDPPLARLAGVEDWCWLPVWGVNAADGAPGSPAEHDTTDLIRGLAVGFGDGPARETPETEWLGIHAALLEALAHVRGFDGVDGLLLSTAMDFEADGHRHEAVRAAETALRLCPASQPARQRFVSAQWRLLCDHLEREPERALEGIREAYRGLDLASLGSPRQRVLASYAYLVSEFFLHGRLDRDCPEVANAERELDDDRRHLVDAMTARGFVDLGQLCGSAPPSPGVG